MNSLVEDGSRSLFPPGVEYRTPNICLVLELKNRFFCGWRIPKLSVKARPDLYTYANKAYRTEANANECQKVSCSAFVAQANEQAFCWSFVGCSNEYTSTSVWLRMYFSLKYQLQTDSVRLFAKHTPHKRMKVNAVCLHIHIMRFHVCVQMWTRLYIEKCVKQKLYKIKFLKKSSMGVCLLSPPWGELGNTKGLPFLKKFTEIRNLVHLGLNAAKSTDYIEKCFSQKLFKIKFPTKNTVNAYLYLYQEWS